jgi:hypothetical protein
MMKKLILPLVFGMILAFCACKKDNINPDIAYRTINQTIKAADANPLTLDLNQDGKIDYTFFAAYSVTDLGVHLNIGTNPIGDNLAKMSLPDDNKFQNMGNIIHQPFGTIINGELKSNQLWASDYAYLAIRTESPQGLKTYIGKWAEGAPQFMALQLSINGVNYFGWARLIFDRTKEILTLIDVAWNKNAGEPLIAGDK